MAWYVSSKGFMVEEDEDEGGGGGGEGERYVETCVRVKKSSRPASLRCCVSPDRKTEKPVS